MEEPEKERKDEPKSSPPPVPPSGPSYLGPDSGSSSNPYDLFKEIDKYQNQIENQWEETKKSYQDKIDGIMDEFIKQQEDAFEKSKEEAAPPPPKKPKPKFEPKKKAKKFEKDKDMDRIMSNLQQTIDHAQRKSKELTYMGSEKPSVINVPWKDSQPWHKKGSTYLILGLVLAALGVAAWIGFFKVAPVTPLPYSHTSSLLFHNNRIYIVDWFRQALYIHKFQKGLPILAVEHMPNKFTTGMSIRRKRYYSMDGFNKEILEHTETRDHRVLNRLDSPATTPVGFYFDGEDYWTVDLRESLLMQLKGNDLEDVINEFEVPRIQVTAFQIIENRVWILEAKSRQVHVYRLEDPLRGLASFDLDPFINGGKPTGLHVEEKKIWVVTESPSQLVQISKRSLEKSNPAKF